MRAEWFHSPEALNAGIHEAGGWCFLEGKNSLPYHGFLPFYLVHKLPSIQRPFCLLFRAVPWPMAIPRLGVESELQLLAYATVTATWDPKCL